MEEYNFEEEIRSTTVFLDEVEEEITHYRRPLSPEEVSRLLELRSEIERRLEIERRILEEIRRRIRSLREEAIRVEREFPPPYVAYSPTYGEIPRRKYILLVRTYRSIVEGRLKREEAMRRYYREMDRNRWTRRVAKEHGVSTRRVAIDLFIELEEGKITIIPTRLVEIRREIITLERQEKEIMALIERKIRVREKIEELLGILYRVELCRVYYKIERGKKNRTPTPLAENRVWVYTQSPDEWTVNDYEKLIGKADEIELKMGIGFVVTEEQLRRKEEVIKTPYTKREGRLYLNVRIVDCKEEEEIEWDEAIMEAGETGYPFRIDEYFYYVVFYRRDSTYIIFFEEDACTYWPPEARHESGLPNKTRPRGDVYREYKCPEIKAMLGEPLTATDGGTRIILPKRITCRLSVDFDEKNDLKLMKKYFEMEHVLNRIPEVRISKSGTGYHFIVRKLKLTPEQLQFLREYFGDDPNRIYLDSIGLGKPRQVLFLPMFKLTHPDFLSIPQDQPSRQTLHKIHKKLLHQRKHLKRKI